ncbi:MAG TPA: triose-phosphate isomerase [Armatimonadetes bacterium]|jgi:triosephosphate isomerase|nr:triose-phosphate isomerase [Armatimonadota bacterium]
MKRIPIVAGNWKMHKTIAEARALVDGLKPGVAGLTGVEVVVCPPYTALAAVREAIEGSEIALGAQDVFWKEKGAYTSQVAPSMLVDAGCRYVIIGHSENRGRFGVPEPEMTEALHRWFGETDESVNKKTKAALAAGLIPIVCVGETLDERRAGKTDEVIAGQVERGLAGLTGEQVGGMVIAYEPVWAIGTGETCDTPEANRVCGMIRGVVERVFGADAAQAVRIQYGGSVKPGNAKELFSQEHIDGGLVGGAALEAESFAQIVRAATS